MNDSEILVARPAVLLDVVEVLPALIRLHNASPREPIPRWTAIRLADIVRRFAPDEALRVLDSAPPGPDPAAAHLGAEAVRAATLLEASKPGAVGMLIPDVEARGGARDLLLGRVAWAKGRLPEAEAALLRAADQAAASDDPLAVEVEIEALGFVLRKRIMEGGDREAIATRLDERCAAAKAPLTQSLMRTLGVAKDEGWLDTASQVLAGIARRTREAEYAAPVNADAGKIGAVPLHVHGAARLHRAEPDRFVAAILEMSSLAWRVGDRIGAYETAWYGQRIAERGFGAAAGRELQSWLDALLGPVSAEERAKLDRALAERATRTPMGGERKSPGSRR